MILGNSKDVKQKPLSPRGKLICAAMNVQQGQYYPKVTNYIWYKSLCI